MPCVNKEIRHTFFSRKIWKTLYTKAKYFSTRNFWYLQKSLFFHASSLIISKSSRHKNRNFLLVSYHRQKIFSQKVDKMLNFFVWRVFCKKSVVRTRKIQLEDFCEKIFQLKKILPLGLEPRKFKFWI